MLFQAQLEESVGEDEAREIVDKVHKYIADMRKYIAEQLAGSLRFNNGLPIINAFYTSRPYITKKCEV